MEDRCLYQTKMYNGTHTQRKSPTHAVISKRDLSNSNHFLRPKNSWMIFLKNRALIRVRILTNSWRPTTKSRCKNRLKKKLLKIWIRESHQLSQKCWWAQTILIKVALAHLVWILGLNPLMKMIKLLNDQINWKNKWEIEWMIKPIIMMTPHLAKSSILL